MSPTPESATSHTQLHNTLPIFLNTLPITNFPHQHKTFTPFLQHLKHHTLKHFHNTHYQFENILQKLPLKTHSTPNPLFHLIFT
ncbi:condensation domain-containing protein, partial [Bacillus velezensis]|uniref:condensation domain-containing protein n=1 Tax=Bacillus velezensis TaxID=492670 RepID=UPI0011A37AFD